MIMTDISSFKPVPRPRLGKENEPPRNFQVNLDDRELAEKFHEYCLENKCSGREVILQLIKALVRK